MAKLDWVGLAAVAAIGVIGYFLGLPWWAIGVIGAGYAAVRIAVEYAWRATHPVASTRGKDEEKGKGSRHP